MERMLHMVQLREDVKKMEVASLIHQMESLEQLKVKLEATVRELLGKCANPGSDLSSLPFFVSKIRLDTAAIAKTERDMVRLKDELEHRKFELSKIAMQRKALEKLKENRKQDFKLNESRAEQKKIDELYQLTTSREKDC